MLDAEDELVDQPQLESWLAIAGRRIGLGDWRPEKSGDYGRFEVEEIRRVRSPYFMARRGRPRRGETWQGEI